MKSKINKGRKRSFSETSGPKKLNQKQEDSNEFKKGAKKGKFANVKQNGHSALGEKAALAPTKVVNKQKQEQNKVKQQSSNVVKSVQAKKDQKKKTDETAVGKKPDKPKRKGKRISFHQRDVSAEEIKKKIEEIKNRDQLSKRARRMLGILIKKLKESGEVKKVNTVENKNNKKLLVRNILLSKQKANDGNKIKGGKKSFQKIKKELQDEDNSEADSDNEDSLDDESLSEESEVEENEKKRIQKLGGSMTDKEKIKSAKKVKKDDEEDEEDIDSDIDEEELESEMDEEELESLEEEEEIESDEDEEELEGEDDEGQIESDDDDDEDEEDEEDAENIKKFEKAMLELKKDNMQKKNKQEQNKGKQVQNKNKQIPQSLNNQQEKDNEEKGIVLFVGNLPANITKKDLHQFFLTKVNTVNKIKIPTHPNNKTQRGFAYVEVPNEAEFEKGLSLHHTLFKKKKIDVEFAIHANDKEIIKKLLASNNAKLRAAVQKASKVNV